MSATLPWISTTPNEAQTSVADTAGASVDFGARPRDIAVFEGLAILEDDFAPEGTPIEAVVNGQVCGTTTMPSSNGGYIGDHMFELYVFGDTEQPGCGRDGDAVRFRIGGVLAAEADRWTPFSEVQTFSQYKVLFLTAMQQHAWYWYQVTGQGLPADGTLVQAVIDGVVCGEARVERVPGIPEGGIPALAGFSKLVVPSADLRPGCGRSGATVSFLFDGIASPGTIVWEPGLTYIDVLPAALPRSGAVSPAQQSPAPIALLALGSLLFGLGVALRRATT